MPDLSRLSNRPLLDADNDSLLFAGRADELDAIDNATRSGLNTLVLGAPGAGKSTLVYQVALRLRRRRQPGIWVDGSLANDVRELIELVRSRLLREPSLTEEWRASMRATTSPASGDLEGLAELLRSLAPSQAELPFATVRPVVLVDGVAIPAIIHTLFGRLRDELWRVPLIWVVTGNERDRLTYLSPPADAFFDVVIQLQPLAEQDVAEVLRRRIPDPIYSALIDEISSLGARQPRAAIQLARSAISSGKQPADLARERAALNARLAELPPSARVLLGQLEQFGPSSASDDALLARLQWSRVRAGQVFRELEDAGLVASALEPTEGSGRPRKVYMARTDA